MKKLIIIGGPTAIGKTEAAIQLADKFHSEIISTDARQFYKELNVGVAKPTSLDLKKIKHHFIGHISIKQKYSVGQFEKDSLELLEQLFKNKDILFLCGGAGLYIDAVCEGLNKFPIIQENIKEKINSDFKLKGLNCLVEELKKNDLDTYNKIDLNNHRRIIRAVEVFRASGKPYSYYINKKKNKRNFSTTYISLTNNREYIYNNINKRVDKMIENGLIDEAKKLYKYNHLQALQTIGYKEVFQYIESKLSKINMIEEIKKNTRRYAKRQINWFNQKKYTPFNSNSNKKIIEFIKNSM
ncbi:MAG: tRNA (adenosine(37)-N6)-dimethylallyltransferase MiaA [Flavobacteriales bacterium]|nr:tRNA (adenosine(37)-N6)-dimethylallyltransferase MiaA [Flavobacteriales bacterium]|tara:strand:- start:6443 stop:7336 length:894 start_codon:yes stop_codon:yes gene_type:complete